MISDFQKQFIVNQMNFIKSTCDTIKDIDKDTFTVQRLSLIYALSEQIAKHYL